MNAVRAAPRAAHQFLLVGFTLLIGILVALWSASGYVGAFGRAMNRIYEVDEGRPFIKLRLTMLGVTVVTVLIVALLALMLVLTGPADLIRRECVSASGGAFVTVWDIANGRWCCSWLSS